MKTLFSTAAILLTIAAFVPYIISSVKNETKPHVFTWVVWSLTTIVVFFAEYKSGAGSGAWPIGVSASLTVLIATIAFLKKADLTIKKIDWVFFILALLSIPLWYFTSNPMWAVIILTSVDLLGFGPTIRKAYDSPREESAVFFSLMFGHYTFTVLALEHYELTTLLFPVAVGIGCLLLLVLLVYRRKMLGRKRSG